MIDWILTNKEWIFSGAGVAAVFVLSRVIKRLALRGKGRRARNDTQAASGPPKSRRVRSKSIPLSSQPMDLLFDEGTSIGLLTMNDGHTARTHVHLVYRVTDPYQFMFAAVDPVENVADPFGVLCPVVIARVRQRLESLSVRGARRRRRELEGVLMEELRPEFGKTGMLLESISVGEIEATARPGG